MFLFSNNRKYRSIKYFKNYRRQHMFRIWSSILNKLIGKWLVGG